jgi:hypothetical protein
VCYVLGVTELDAARMDLLLECFISKERYEPPDNRHDEPRAGLLEEGIDLPTHEVVVRERSRLWKSTTGQYGLSLTLDTPTRSAGTGKRREAANRRRREDAAAPGIAELKTVIHRV